MLKISSAEDIIVDDWLFPFPVGTDATIKNCQYFPADNGYSVEALVDWRGPLEGRYYAALVEFDLVGQNSNWQILEVNTTLSNHLGNVALGGLVAAALTDSSSREYYFTNSCSVPVNLAIYYRDTSGAWVADGWWRFNPGQSSYLVADGQRLSSTNNIWYYYAETTDGALVWRGDQRINFDGSSLSMKELRDSSGDYSWSVNC
ncbi:MAG: DUF1036 domain-containing protein [Cyanothece sp. SIO2G6]|nr:DUF1036 domain-containing protein [Cyanothece sp. SIO2G6]